jgi:hypothetical protein
MDLMHLVEAVLPHFSPQHSTSTIPDDHPKLLSCDKVPSFYPKFHHFTIPELHRYIGFCQLNDWTSVLDVAQPTISFDTSTHDTPLKLGDVTNIKKVERLDLRT